MPVLAVIPGNTLDDLCVQGIGRRLQAYYNPASFFDRVVCLSPFEAHAREAFGMRVIPCKDIELPARLRELNVDVVRAYGSGTPAEMAVFHRARATAVIISVHDKRACRISPAIRFADAVFVVSDELRPIVEGLGVAGSRVFVVPNGVDGGLMRPLPAGASEDLARRFPFARKLLHVGRRSPEKNVEAVVRALVRLGPDHGLVSVGQGDPGALEGLARELGVAGRCVFLPAVPQEELVRFYNWADCVCHPSRSEAMCHVLLEALACGCAVVTTTTAAQGLGDEAMQGMLLVRDPDDVNALAAQVRRACEDDAVRHALLAGARRSIEGFFLERTQALEVATYNKVLAMKASGVFRRGFADDARLWMADVRRRFARRFGGRR